MPSAQRTRTYTKEEVLAAAMAYFHGDELAASTWVNKYALRNREGDLVEASPADMHRRMAREFARIEARQIALPADRRALLSAYGRERNALNEEAIFKLFDGFRDIVPQGTRLVETSPHATEQSDGSLVWQLGTMKPGEEKSVSLQLMPVGEGEIGSVATVMFAAQASARSTSASGTRPSPVAMTPRITPPERRRRVSARVSMSEMATILLATR